MVKLTLEQVNGIKALHNAEIEKLTATLEHTIEGEVGPIRNIQAPCLVRGAVRDAIEILAILNKAEDVAARAGDLEGEREAEALLAYIKEQIPNFGASTLKEAIEWLTANLNSANGEVQRVTGILATSDQVLADVKLNLNAANLLVEGLKESRDNDAKKLEAYNEETNTLRREIEYLRAQMRKAMSHIEAGPAHEECTAATMCLENAMTEFGHAERVKAWEEESKVVNGGGDGGASSD